MKPFSWILSGDKFQFDVFTFRHVDRLFSFVTESSDLLAAVRYFQVVGPALASPPSQTVTRHDVMSRRDDVTSQVECQEVQKGSFLGSDGPGARLMRWYARCVKSSMREDVSWCFSSSVASSTKT